MPDTVWYMYNSLWLVVSISPFLPQCHPSTLGCGTVIIGTSQSHTLTLLNPGPCPLYYRLGVEEEGGGEGRGGATSGDCEQCKALFLLRQVSLLFKEFTCGLQ